MAELAAALAAAEAEVEMGKREAEDAAHKHSVELALRSARSVCLACALLCLVQTIEHAGGSLLMRIQRF